MAKIGFVGFGEVNTPVEVIIKKCEAAANALRAEGLDLVTVYPVADDYEELGIKNAVAALEKERFDALVVCVAGWIPTHAVIKVTEHYRHLPMVLWGLCGWYEGDRLVTTADQAGTTGLRATNLNTFTILSAKRPRAHPLHLTAAPQWRQSNCCLIRLVWRAIAI